MKKTSGLALATSVVMLASTASVAGSDPGSWYVSPMIQGVWLDKDRKADDGVGASLAFGRVLTDKWNVEVGVGGSNHNLDGTDNKLKLQNWDLGLQRVFYRNETVNPYIIAGLGRIEDRLPGAGRDGSFYLKYGVGVLADISKDTRKGTNLQLRGEVLGRQVDRVGNIDTQSAFDTANPGAGSRWRADPTLACEPGGGRGDGALRVGAAARIVNTRGHGGDIGEAAGDQPDECAVGPDIAWGGA